MTSPQAEEEGVLREWAPFSKFLRQIPLRTRQGIFLENINFTCVGADVDCVAVGTSSGHIFWYNRVSHEVQQLRPEKSPSPITCVAVVSSVEFMVAAGDKLGVLSIFRIPKDLPDWFGEPKPKPKTERYTIDELHSSRITALTWSMNGQKLFSGDESGVVVFTEVDHKMSITRACEVVNEKFKIVQLCYNQNEQVLVVATDLRVIICRYSKPNWKVIQVGQRDRHCLQELGASIAIDENHLPSVYCCRGGLRLWKSNLDGNVEHTIKFKGVVETSSNPIKLLRPLKPSKRAGTNLIEFGKLYHWRDGLLVSHWQDTLLVFDPSSVRVVATIKDAELMLTDVATTQKEIFLVFGQRELVRLSYSPDSFESSLGGFGNLASGEPVTGIPNFSLNPVIGVPLLSSSVKTSRVKLSAKTANSEPRANEVSYGVDSTILIPAVVAMGGGVPELRLDSSKQHQFSSIGQEEFDEIIFTKHKRKKSRRSKSVVLDSNRNSGEFHSDDYETESGSSMASSMIEVECEQEEPACILEVTANSLPVHLLPDPRPIDEIVQDFKMKEELLESTVIFPPPLEDLSPASESNNTVVEVMDVVDRHNDNFADVGCSESNADTNPHDESTEWSAVDPDSITRADGLDTNGLQFSPVSSTMMLPTICSNPRETIEDFERIFVEGENGNLHTDRVRSSAEDIVSLISSEVSASIEGDVIVDEEPIDLVENLTISDVAVTDASDEPVEYATAAAVDPSPEPEESYLKFPILYQTLTEGWTEMSCPDHPSWVACHADGVVMCSPTFQTYTNMCDSDSWVKLPYEASHIFLSPDGQLGVRIHCSAAYYSCNWISKNNWKLLSRNVESIYVLNDKLWFVSQGELYHMLLCSELVDRIQCPHKLLKIFGDSDTLFAINHEQRLLMLRGQDWVPVRSFKEKIKHFCYGPNRLYWIVDHDHRIFVIDDPKGPRWWQVIVADFKLHEQLTLAANEAGIYVANSAGKTIAYNTTSVPAITWTLSGVKVDCVQMSAEGVFEDKGCVWVLCKGNRLIGIPSTLDSIHHVKAPCKIVCVASRPQALWLLSEDGEIFIKLDITEENPLGADWKKMDSEQLREKQMQISYLSCGVDVVWACDIRGKILMLVGSPHAISNCSFTPAWVLVEGSALQGHTFTKVFVGPRSHMVWALDSAGNVYVREAIYSDLPVGVSWVHVPDLKASHLTISSETVWALSHGGIFRRTGISESNFIGESWTRVDAAADHISVTVDEKLLSVEDGRVRELSEMVFPFSDEILVERDWTLL